MRKLLFGVTSQKNIDWLHEEITVPSVKIHGKLSIEERNNSVEKFLNDGSIKLLLATPGSAKEGLTLTVANHAIFFDRGLSLDDYLQSQDRIHRVSQTKPCFIYLLKMQDSVDEWIDKLLKAKGQSANLFKGIYQRTEFKDEIDYSFGEILNKILGKSKYD